MFKMKENICNCFKWSLTLKGNGEWGMQLILMKILTFTYCVVESNLSLEMAKVTEDVEDRLAD